MKTKIYKWAMTAIAGLLLAAAPAEAGTPQSYYGGSGTTVVNNYYMDDFGYHYSSRINRFHRSYSAFEYYAPVYKIGRAHV